MKTRSLLCLLLPFLLTGCDIKSYNSNDYKQLLQLQRQQREAHINKNPEMLVSMFSEDFISVDSGSINRPTGKESRNRFQAYFDNVEFIAWDNIEEPVIRISSDGTMAYIIVHKRVHLRIPSADRENSESRNVFAWMETWEKRNGEWKMTAIASTDRPEDPDS